MTAQDIEAIIALVLLHARAGTLTIDGIHLLRGDLHEFNRAVLRRDGAARRAKELAALTPLPPLMKPTEDG